MSVSFFSLKFFFSFLLRLFTTTTCKFVVYLLTLKILKMKKILSSVIILSSLAFVSCKSDNKAGDAVDVEDVSQEAVSVEVDVEASKIEWEGSKPTGKHNGTISLSSGAFFVNNNELSGGKFVFDMNSIDVLDLEGDDKAYLEAHLKGTAEGKEDHFFDVAKFPEGEFEISSVETLESGETKVSGNLTLKGITKNISFVAKVAISDDEVKIYSETFSINRTDWGVNYGSKSIFDDLGDKFINDNIDLKIDVVGKR